MQTLRIERGTRWYPAGLDALGDDAPQAVFVRGNTEPLAEQGVLITGTPGALPRAQANTRAIVSAIAETDVVTIGHLENLLSANAVLEAASASGGAVLVARYWGTPRERKLLEAGATVVAFTDENNDTDFSTEDYHRWVAAFADITLVPEADTRSAAIAHEATRAGRKVLVLEPLHDGPAFQGGIDLLHRPGVSLLTRGGPGGALTAEACQEIGRGIVQMLPPASRHELLGQLDYLEFSGRVAELRAAGRIDTATEQMLLEMANDSVDLEEFQARMHYGGARILGATEHRYLTSALETPEGQRPDTWAEADAYVRAFGFDRYSTVCKVQQLEQDHQMQAAPAYAQ